MVLYSGTPFTLLIVRTSYAPSPPPFDENTQLSIHKLTVFLQSSDPSSVSSGTPNSSREEPAQEANPLATFCANECFASASLLASCTVTWAPPRTLSSMSNKLFISSLSCIPCARAPFQTRKSKYVQSSKARYMNLDLHAQFADAMTIKNVLLARKSPSCCFIQSKERYHFLQTKNTNI